MDIKEIKASIKHIKNMVDIQLKKVSQERVYKIELVEMMGNIRWELERLEKALQGGE